MEDTKSIVGTELSFVKDKLSFTKNSSFHEAVVRIFCPGENDNGMYFGKKSIENALWSLKNIPLVGLYKEDKDDFGGHEYKYKIDKKNKKTLTVFNTTPYGVIPESAKQWFEVVEENGIKKEYLCSECLFWKRQNGYELLKEKGKFSVSMEIDVKDGQFSDETQLYEVNDFIFTAIAILGSETEPCFKSAQVQLFSKNEDYSDMMKDLKFYSKQIDELKKDGGEMPEEQQAPMPQSSPIIEQLVSTGISQEQAEQIATLVGRIDEVKAMGIDVSQFLTEVPTAETLVQAGIPEEQVESVISLVQDIISVQESGIDMSQFFVKEEFASEDENKDEEQGQESTEEESADKDEETEDSNEEEVDSKSDMQQLLESAVGATTTDQILDIFDQMLAIAGLGEVDIRTMFSKEKEDVKAEFSSIVAEFEKIKPDYERLVAFEQEILQKRKEEEINKVFERFARLQNVDGFDDIKQIAFELSTKELEDQLYILAGKQQFSLQKEEQKEEIPMTIMFESNARVHGDAPGVLGKYLPKR